MPYFKFLRSCFGYRSTADQAQPQEKVRAPSNIQELVSPFEGATVDSRRVQSPPRTTGGREDKHKTINTDFGQAEDKRDLAQDAKEHVGIEQPSASPTHFGRKGAESYTVESTPPKKTCEPGQHTDDACDVGQDTLGGNGDVEQQSIAPTYDSGTPPYYKAYETYGNKAPEFSRSAVELALAASGPSNPPPEGGFHLSYTSGTTGSDLSRQRRVTEEQSLYLNTIRYGDQLNRGLNELERFREDRSKEIEASTGVHTDVEKYRRQIVRRLGSVDGGLACSEDDSFDIGYSDCDKSDNEASESDDVLPISYDS